MTIINQTYQFIFVHIPKNAGTTATAVLSTYTYWSDIELGGTKFGEALAPWYLNRFGLGKHTKAQAIRNVVGERIWDRYYKFALVRNPYSRAYSIYKFLSKWKEWPNSSIMDEFDSFDSFICSRFFQETSGPDNMFSPQYTWICDVNENLLVDYIGKVEDIDTSMETISAGAGLGIKLGALPRINQSGNSGNMDVSLSDATDAIIKKLYKRDFRLLNYDASVRWQNPK